LRKFRAALGRPFPYLANAPAVKVVSLYPYGMKYFFLFWWQLPQHILAGVLILLTRARYTHTVRWCNRWIRVYRTSRANGRWGISLGFFTILDPVFNRVTERHELGHSVDSHRMGPLYLLWVGFWSAVMHNLIGSRILGRGYKWYYTRRVEARADRYGGVVWHNGHRVLANASELTPDNLQSLV